MGRPPSNGGPPFRFNPPEVAEMENILQEHNITMPPREILEELAKRFSSSAERSGKFVVQMKQVWNWFQNRRYAIRAKSAKSPGRFIAPPALQSDPAAVKAPAELIASSMPQSDPAAVRIMPQASQSMPSPQVRTMSQAPQPLPAPSVPVQNVSRSISDNSQMEFEAKSARDGAWYDVACFLSHRSVESGEPEVLVRFAGFGAEEDEWVNVRKHVRQRSLPCESSECIAVLPTDLILCFQEGKDQALYYDAHVLDAQRRRHDVRGCRCRFLVHYDHDQSEKIGDHPTTGNTMKVYPTADAPQKAQTESRLKQAEPTQKQPASENTIKPEPAVAPTLPKPSTDSLITLVGTTPKIKEEMTENPMPLAEIKKQAPAEPPDQPSAERTPKTPAEATEEPPAETLKRDETPEQPPAETTADPPAASTSNPDEAAPKEPPAETTSTEGPPAETTIEPPADSTSEPAEASEEPPADSMSMPVEAPEEQPMAEEHVDVGATAASTDQDNAPVGANPYCQ
ncbi:unnamed protein product [Withania somnifera]